MYKLYFLIHLVAFTAASYASEPVPEVPTKVIDIQASDVIVYRVHLETGDIQYIREITLRNGDVCRTVVDNINANDVYNCGPNQDQKFVKPTAPRGSYRVSN